MESVVDYLRRVASRLTDQYIVPQGQTIQQQYQASPQGRILDYLGSQAKNAYEQYVRSPQGEMLPNAVWKKPQEEQQNIWSDFFTNAVIGATAAPVAKLGTLPTPMKLGKSAKPKTFYEALQEKPNKPYSETLGEREIAVDTYDFGKGVKMEISQRVKDRNGRIPIIKNPNAWAVERIISTDRGKGNASKALNEVMGLADKYGITLQLEATPFGKGGMTKPQLIEWYKRKGFVVGEGGYLYKYPSKFEASK